jgi:general secretion pathway protein G
MTSPLILKRKQAAFTLVEVLMVIGLLGILSVVSVGLMNSSVDESRFNETVSELGQIRDAMIGNINIREAHTRTSFGFLGDVGAIPTSGEGIAALITNPSLAVYAVNSTVRFGLGWNGPYLTGGANANFINDAWGNAIVYSPNASPATLISYGADGIAGGTGFNADITVNLPVELTTATVSGFICQSGGAFVSSAQVEFNVPDGTGALTQSEATVAAVDKGYFSFFIGSLWSEINFDLCAE